MKYANRMVGQPSDENMAQNAPKRATNSRNITTLDTQGRFIETYDEYRNSGIDVVRHRGSPFLHARRD